MGRDMDDLIADFLVETNENLGALDEAILKLEQDPADAQTVSLIFRLMHTIKGTCGFLGLQRLEAVAHAAENVLGKCRDGVLVPTPESITTILAAIDRIRLILSGLETTQSEPSGDDGQLIAALDAIIAGDPPPATEAELEEIFNAPAEPAPNPALETPAPAPVEAEIVAHKATAVAAAPEADQHASSVAGQTIRVGVEVLENLMTLVSELVLSRNQLLQLSRSVEDSPFNVPLQRLSHITSDLQEGVMKARMQPIGHAWNKVPRLVRDLARDLNKKIELVMLGAETELDRQVLELIKDPLTHMVRNSADHGIEDPMTRRAAGKPETGRLTLNAYHEGGHIIIEIADDGRGLPMDKIRAKAISSGVCTEAELAQMPDSQIRNLVFHAGFSTAEKVTAVSGRGVGMDVVRTNIERIGGTIDVQSTEGQGSTFSIKIPITLAIVSALVVAAGGERFAIPQISVVELVRAGVDAPIERISRTPVLRLRNRLLPLVRLSELLGLGESDNTGRESDYVVVTQVGANTFGIIVDRVFDTEDIVVKPLAPILRHLSVFSGNTILGDGSVIMILDPNGIARAADVSLGRESATAGKDIEQSGVHATTGEKVALLLFRAGGAEPKAVPLTLVSRIEDMPRESIEHTSAGDEVLQYRDHLLPLVRMGVDTSSPRQPILVFTDGDCAMGLLVDEIIDIVEDVIKIELGKGQDGTLGSAVINGKATDVIDTAYWLSRASDNWFTKQAQKVDKRRLLVVEDSAFFSQMLVPVLSSAGYEVTAVLNPAEALRLREAGSMFDAIVTDIEMPGMDGFTFAKEIRRDGIWMDLPVIALSSLAEPEHLERGRQAGFTEHVQKMDREGLMQAIAFRLSPAGALVHEGATA